MRKCWIAYTFWATVQVYLDRNIAEQNKKDWYRIVESELDDRISTPDLSYELENPVNPA